MYVWVGGCMDGWMDVFDMDYMNLFKLSIFDK